MGPILLCSSSKTRAKILEEANISFIQKSVDFDEERLKYTAPRSFVYYASLGKLKAAEAKFGLEKAILTADTVVVSNGKILRKAKDKEDARKILLEQSNNKVSIITAMHLKSKELYFTDLSKTEYIFDKFDEKELEEYLDSNLWKGKAGACMVEGFCKKYIKKVIGFESCAKGLLVEKLLPWIEEIDVLRYSTKSS